MPQSEMAPMISIGRPWFLDTLVVLGALWLAYLFWQFMARRKWQWSIRDLCVLALVVSLIFGLPLFIRAVFS
jgi:hypothetical protein